MAMQKATLLNSVTTTVTGAAFPLTEPNLSMSAIVSGTGAVTSTVYVDVSNDKSTWHTLATAVLSGTTSDSAAVAGRCPWGYVRGRVGAITGTSAAVKLVINAAPN